MPWNKDSDRSPAAYFIKAALLLFSARLLLFGQAIPPVASSPNQAPAAQTPANPASAPVQPPQHMLLIMIDPAHGGSDSGAVFNPSLLEKDVTLGLSRRLRQELSTRGLPAQLLRDFDGTLSTDQRAAMVNAAHPALYLCVHATSQGSGMRIYTAMLPVGGDDHGLFLDWQTAQSASLARSRWAQQQLAASVQKTGFPVRSLTAPLRPLNTITVPAVAIELAPTTGDVAQLASADYQQMITAALANSIASIMASLRATLGSTSQ
jgi:N-acetylmuramoyl-L-alanine amidase